MLKDFIDGKYIDESTGLLGYATWGKLNETDPEVDSPYLTCYAAMSDIIFDKKNNNPIFYRSTETGNFYLKLVIQYVAFENRETILLRRFPRAGQTYTEGSEKDKPKEAHFNNPHNLSGDNTLPIIILMGELGLVETVKKLLKTHIRRGFFYQNSYTNNGEPKLVGDFMLPHLSVFIRSMGGAYFILLFTDLLLLINILVHVVESWFRKDNTASELNYYFMLVQSQRFKPTPWSWLAVQLYKWRGKIYKDEPRIHGAIKEFFTIRGDKRPPMHIHLRAVTSLYFGE